MLPPKIVSLKPAVCLATQRTHKTSYLASLTIADSRCNHRTSQWSSHCVDSEGIEPGTWWCAPSEGNDNCLQAVAPSHRHDEVQRLPAEYLYTSLIRTCLEYSSVAPEENNGNRASFDWYLYNHDMENWEHLTHIHHHSRPGERMWQESCSGKCTVSKHPHYDLL